MRQKLTLAAGQLRWYEKESVYMLSEYAWDTCRLSCPLSICYHETCFSKATQFASLVRGLNSALHCCWDTLLSLSVENTNQPLLHKLQALMIADAGELADDVCLAGLLLSFGWARI